MKRTIHFAVVLVILALVSLSACSEKKQQYSVEAKIDIPQLNGERLVFEEIKGGEMVASDTVTIENSEFSLKGKIKDTSVRTVYMIGDNAGSFKPFEIVLEEGNLDLKIDKDGNVKRKGTLLNDKLQQRDEEFQKFVEVITGVKAEMDALEASGALTPEKQAEYATEFKTLIDGNVDKTIAFTKENIDNPLGKYYFHKNYFLMPAEKKEEMMSFATDDIKEKYGIAVSKPEESKAKE